MSLYTDNPHVRYTKNTKYKLAFVYKRKNVKCILKPFDVL